MSKELKVSFYLRHKEVKKDGTVPIMGRITIDKRMAQFSAKLSVATPLWDIKAARALGKSKVATELNRALDRITVSIHSSHKELMERKGTATPKEVVVAFQGMASGQESLLKYCDKFFAMMSQRIGINLKEKSCNQYRIAFNYLRNFLKAKYNLKDISFGALDYSFIEKFDHYLRVELGFKPNSVVGIIGRIKLMIRRAITDDVILFDPFISFRSQGEVSQPKTLTREELERVMTTPLDIPSRYLVRDLFIFSAFTGISFSDIGNLKYSDLTTSDDGTVWIHSKRIKTGVEFHVPLLHLPIQLIDKYRGSTDGEHLFRLLSNVKTNIHLKKIAQMCGVEKCLTFHQARHCYASVVTLSQGIPMETVSRMLGHSTVKSTRIYAQISYEKVDSDMRLLAKSIKGKYKLANI
ncbi:MAG: site-specific integrase [Rikenellaceae bacterium]